MTKKTKKLASALIAVAYLRVSKDEKIQELGTEAQRAAILAWAAAEHVEIVAWFTDEVSGGAPMSKRPALAQAIAAVEAHRAASLVSLRVDRFSRDRIETGVVELALRRAGAALVFADGVANGDSPAERFMRTILLGAADLERSLIAARVTAALAVKKSRNELTGQAPFGMRAVDGPLRAGRDGVEKPVKMLVEDEAEQLVIKRVVALSDAGLSIRKIEAALAAEGVVGRAGRPLTRDAVDKILSRHTAE